MKRQNPSFPLFLLAGAVASACGGSTEINYVEDSGGSAGDGGLGGNGGTAGSDAGGAGGIGGTASGGSSSGGTASGGSAGNTTSSGGSAGDTTSSGGSATTTTGGMGGTAGDGGTQGSSVSSGGTTTTTTGGAGGSGGSGGDPGCLATGCPTGKYCDGDTRECNDLKAPGEACTRTQECDDLLDCLDGVCCNDDECPACLNCGSDGECSVTVQDAEDVTGNECMDEQSCDPEGVCKLELGQACGDDDQCVSGHCVDQVCCGDSSCPDCYNCGDDGACSVPVVGTDDVTSECNGITTCDSGAECTARWSLVTAFEVSEEYITNYSTSVGSTFFFANADGYHVAYDVLAGTSYEAPLNSDYCWCGATGAAVSDGTSIFYFANEGRMWTPGDPGWVDVPTYADAGVSDGEGAFAVTGGRVYRVGGRYYTDRLSYYDIETGNFVIDGLPDHPEGGVAGNACGGAVNGKVYVFGWDEGGFTEYDPNSNTWTELPPDPNTPYCWGQSVPAWGSYLVYADGSELQLLNTALLVWEEDGIPLPDAANLRSEMALVVGDTLYVAGYDRTADEIRIYQYMLGGVGSGG